MPGIIQYPRAAAGVYRPCVHSPATRKSRGVLKMSSSKDKAPPSGESNIDRRNFMGAALGAAAGAGAAAMMTANAQGTLPSQQRPTPSPPASAPPAGSGLDRGVRPGGPQLFRVEADINDVEIDGKIPADLEG